MSDAPPLLFGVGVGPGDPDLMTVRARRVLDEADRIVHFCKHGRRGNARTTLDRVIPPDPEREIALAYPVTTEIPVEEEDYAAALRDFYEEAASTLAQHLEAGRRVAVICDGDPFFYGSFMHLWRRLAHRFPTEIVAGVPAMAGAWARAALPITWGDDILTVMPGTLPEAELTSRLRATDAAVIMKLGRNLPKAMRAIAAAGLTERAVYVERATMAGERILPVASIPSDGMGAPYFGLILIAGQGRRP